MVLEVMEKEFGEYEEMMGGGSIETLEIKVAVFEKTLAAYFINLEQKLGEKFTEEVDNFITKMVNRNQKDMKKHFQSKSS